VQAISRAIIKEARSAEERVFLLAELMLELARVRPADLPGGMRAGQVRTQLRIMIAELRSAIAAESLAEVKSLRAYLDAASAAVS
jgi:hypothetical protein